MPPQRLPQRCGCSLPTAAWQSHSGGMAAIKTEHAERGAQAEADFQGWLDASRLPYVYATQDRESVPAHFRLVLKRPDYLVALPYVGTIAFDVKSKTTYEDGFLFDVAEVRRLAHFDDLFRVSTFFACLDPAGSPQSVWFRVVELMQCPVRKMKGKPAHAVPFTAGVRVDMGRAFQDALRDIISMH